jgi:hypothetical protein
MNNPIAISKNDHLGLLAISVLRGWNPPCSFAKLYSTNATSATFNIKKQMLNIFLVLLFLVVFTSALETLSSIILLLLIS